MQIHVYDTHVTTAEGKYLHFDVLVDDSNTANVATFVERYLQTKGIVAATLASASCQFCHSEAANPEVQQSIHSHGYYILPISGC
ncbi:DUF2024 family protein [Shewanella sp. Scap07]|uniref:DUF2024 family protein n=1 Tax=Shewanella sp. Scap07 TaxID=2589987 RepID=UPI0015B85126|nr:DUF2024 family protein [Shewanella sp. Scap07]QLE84172.1 DUF2024 family protein [Shewanella sp. Scap07]